MPAAFGIGTHWGLLGVSVSWIAAFPLALFLMLRRTLPLINLSIIELLYAIMPSAIASAIMYAMVYAAKRYMHAPMSTPASMLTYSVFGAAVYVLIVLAINKRGARELVEIIKR